MPSVSKAQENLMGAAEHGADFPMAEKVRASMTHDQMHDFAVGPEAGKPEHVLKGDRPDIMGANRKVFKARGMNEADATKSSILASKKGRPNNLGTFLHPKRGSK